MSSIQGRMLSTCEYLTQIASMSDAGRVTTDGPLLDLNDHEMLWVPLDSPYRDHAVEAVRLTQ